MNPIPFIGSAYQGRSDNYSTQRCVNWYLEPGKGKTPAQLIGCPGLTAPWITLTGAGMRGMYGVDDTNAVMVCGGNVYKVTSGATNTLIGTVPDDNRPVQIAGNGTEFAIASGGNLYSVTLTSTVSTLLETGVSGVDFSNYYFLATQTGTNNFLISNLTGVIDPITYTGGNVGVTGGAPDTIVGVRTARNTVYFFGTKSLESWYFSAQSIDQPFTSIDGGLFEIGCIAKDSIAELDAVFWLGGDDHGAGSVWTVEGGGPKRISTPAIEFAISKWPDMTDAEAFTYSHEGHAFYVLSSVSGNETWAYDIATGEWHQRAWLHPSGALHRHRARCHLYFAGKHLVGDWQNGNVYELDLNTYSDNGNALPAIRSTVALQQNLLNLRNASFRLDMDTGVGLTTGQGSDPQAMLRCSKDGGKTWTSSLWRTFGKIGEYSRRCWWHRVGGGERMVFEVTITDPVRRNITGAFYG
jgi:hypothetical protein